MSHISNIAAAAEKLNITAGEARASIPALRRAWLAASADHEASMAAAEAAFKDGQKVDYAPSRITAEKLSAAQRALNAAQWASGERWNLRAEALRAVEVLRVATS